MKKEMIVRVLATLGVLIGLFAVPVLGGRWVTALSYELLFSLAVMITLLGFALSEYLPGSGRSVLRRRKQAR